MDGVGTVQRRPSAGDLVVITAEAFADLLAKEELADGIVNAITEFDPPAAASTRVDL